jgi:hypothetical protein
MCFQSTTQSKYQHGKASTNMAVVTLENVEIMEDQNALVFFTILE